MAFYLRLDECPIPICINPQAKYVGDCGNSLCRELPTRGNGLRGFTGGFAEQLHLLIKLPQEAQVVLVKEPNVVNAVAEHR